MHESAQAEHRWLEQLVGEWSCEWDSTVSPDPACSMSKARERVRSLGGLWVVLEAEFVGPEGRVDQTIMTLGFNPKLGRFTGTFVGSMMTHLWVYSGTLDPGGRSLTLEAEGPSFDPEGGTARYRDHVELVDDGSRVLWSEYLDKDGSWKRFMRAVYRRLA